jgi:hypothetical protein
MPLCIGIQSSVSNAKTAERPDPSYAIILVLHISTAIAVVHNLHYCSIPITSRLRVGLVSFQDLQGFRDLGAQGLGRLQQMQELRIVHLEKHTGNLTGQLGL